MTSRLAGQRLYIKKRNYIKIIKDIKKRWALYQDYRTFHQKNVDGLSRSNGLLTNLFVFDLSLIDEWHRVDNL
ncbi:hypothetical protein EIC00_14620 [Vibrio parahaemolyticus]|nr:hypothetical protein [Vibrio parahaemolyticus]